jgi:hypothetical protein
MSAGRQQRNTYMGLSGGTDGLFFLGIGGEQGAPPPSLQPDTAGSQKEGEKRMELEAVVRQLMERSFEASVREAVWSFADHALVETLVALMLSRIQPLPVEPCAEASLQQEHPA